MTPNKLPENVLQICTEEIKQVLASELFFFPLLGIRNYLPRPAVTLGWSRLREDHVNQSLTVYSETLLWPYRESCVPKQARNSRISGLVVKLRLDAPVGWFSHLSPG